MSICALSCSDGRVEEAIIVRSNVLVHQEIGTHPDNIRLALLVSPSHVIWPVGFILLIS